MGYIGQPLNAGNLAADVFSGDGSTTGFTLSYSVGSANSISIYIDGVKQAVSTYTASGTTLTFTTAPPSGTNNIEVIFLALEITLPTPGDNTVTSAKIVDGTITGTDVASDTITPDNISIDEGALAVDASNQTITTGTWTKVELDEETYDLGADFDNSTNYRYTVPTGGAGKHLIIAQVQYTSTDAKTHECAIYINGTSEYFTSTNPGRGNFGESVGLAIVLELADADYVEMYTRHDKGSDATLLGPSSTNDRSWLNVIKMD